MAGFDDLQQFLALVRAQDNLVLLGHRPKFTTQNLLVKPLVGDKETADRERKGYHRCNADLWHRIETPWP
jgi:hypothetical protein